MYADLREKLTVLLFQYSYKTIDDGLKELINEYKYHFDQDYAAINPVSNEQTDKVVKISGTQACAMHKEMVVVPEGCTATEHVNEPKKIVMKKPRKSKNISNDITTVQEEAKKVIVKKPRTTKKSD